MMQFIIGMLHNVLPAPHRQSAFRCTDKCAQVGAPSSSRRRRKQVQPAAGQRQRRACCRQHARRAVTAPLRLRPQQQHLMKINKRNFCCDYIILNIFHLSLIFGEYQLARNGKYATQTETTETGDREGAKARDSQGIA